MAHEDGLAIVAPVHDAILLEAPLETLDRDVARLREIMTEAGRIVLDGFPVRTDAELVRWPDRYSDARGVRMWQLVAELADLDPDTHVLHPDTHVLHPDTHVLHPDTHVLPSLSV
jgi:DNA polymerase-1